MNLKLSLLILSCFACMYLNGVVGLGLLTGLRVQARLEYMGRISSRIYGLGINQETVNNLVYYIRQLERRRYELEALRRRYFRNQNIDEIFRAVNKK
uniref:BLS5B n=1 Tax=Schmidtea mediterranea TaxID=79327 RepID=A0A6F9F231_SCHMD|nr:TPA_exp: BLS5B [Schmidtea mediterranea]